MSESLQKLKETELSIYQAITNNNTIMVHDMRQNQIVDPGIQVSSTIHTPSSSEQNISMQILEGFIAVLGCAAVAIGFTVLNAATLGIAGLVLTSLGAAAVLGGIGLFSYKHSKTSNHQSTSLIGFKL